MKLSNIALACSCCSLLTSELAAQPAGADLVRDSVSYRSGDVTIAASLIGPATAAGAPAVVIAHGSGASSGSNPWTSAYVEALAASGIVVLYPDKRGSGSSTGDWQSASIDDLAADVTAGLELLRAQPGVDTSRVGVLAFSQGGYVAARLAAGDTRVKYTVVVSGGVASFRTQIIDEIVLEAEALGSPLSADEVRSLRAVYELAFRFADTHAGWDQYRGALAVARENGGALAHAVRTLPTDSTHWALRYVRIMGDFRPLPHWEQVLQPVVFVFGGLDAQVKIAESVRQLHSLRNRDRISIIIAGNNGHALYRDDVNAFLIEWVRRGGID